MKRIKILIILSILLIVAVFIYFNRKPDYSQFLLLSDREAPLGWTYFTIYKDSTFEYISRGLSDKKTYKGKAIIKKDSILLKYYDNIPEVGTKVFYTEKYIEFVDSKKYDFKPRLEVRLNRLIE